MMRILTAAIAALSVAGASTSGRGQQGDSRLPAAGLHELFVHDACTGDYAPQPDTCLHRQLVEKAVTFGGKAGATYDVRLRIRGIFEPTTIEGGETPYPEHPYYKAGGAIRARDWSAWHIDVAEPKQTYWLNHYPRVGHTIYNVDFDVTIPIVGTSRVVIRVVDGNDRQIDNAEPGRPDRMQIIKGVQDKPLDGQMVRFDVLSVTAR